MKAMHLFTYGSLILPDSKIRLYPEYSVFLKGYKIVAEKSPITQTNYHYLLLQETGIESDIVPGYLAKVDEELLGRLDAYEGKSYRRTAVIVLTRNMEEVAAFAYIKA